MTLSDVIIEVYEGSDEQSDLSPYATGLVSLDAPGSLRIRRAVVRAQDTIATWKLANGHRIRFRELEDIAYGNFRVFTGQEGGTSRADMFSGDLHSTEIDCTGRILRLDDGSTYFIARHDALSMYPATPIPVLKLTDTARNYSVHTQRWEFSGADRNSLIPWRMIELLSVVDTVTQRPLTLGEQGERYFGNLKTVGIPQSFVKFGTGLIFDVAPLDTRTYVIRGVRYPNETTSLTGELELPRAFHDAIVAHATHWALGRIGEGTRQITTWNKLDRLMATLRTQADFESDYSNGQMQPQS